MEQAAQADTKNSSKAAAINATSILACLPEPVLELILAAAGPRARFRAARASRGVRDAALLPEKYWREAFAQRWWHDRAPAAPAAGAFAARIKGERHCCELLTSLSDTGNQLTWRLKNGCVERAGDLRELLARVAAATHVYEEPHTIIGPLRPPPATATTAAWVAEVSPYATRVLTCPQASVMGTHARDLLTHVQTARLRARWVPAADLKEASERVSSVFRVFYDGDGVERELGRLGARARAAANLVLPAAAPAPVFDDESVGHAALRLLADDAAVQAQYADQSLTPRKLAVAVLRSRGRHRRGDEDAILQDVQIALMHRIGCDLGLDSVSQLSLVRATEAVLFEGPDGFRGVEGDQYYAAANSFLDEVLRRRAGIPISLACLFVAVAERAGVVKGALRPVSAPGHFLLAFGIGDDAADAADFVSRAIFIDVFARHRGPQYGSLNFMQVAEFISQHVGVTGGQAGAYLFDACRNYARPDEVGARCARNLMLILETEVRRHATELVTGQLAGGVTHGARPPTALDIDELGVYRQLELTFRNGGRDDGTDEE